MKTKVGIALITASLMVAGCSSPGSDSKNSANTGETINQPVTIEEVAALGDITLDVWADAGEENTMKNRLN